jgi:titin
VISGNGLQGIALESESARGNVIQGNYIGTNPSGTAAMANSSAGVSLLNSPDNIIGGTILGAGNLISGSRTNAGIILQSPATTRTLIHGNFIGTTADGNAAIANWLEGIFVYGAVSNIIGGSLPGAGNLISGNRTKGILLLNNASGNLIQGNRIGTRADGTNALPNGSNGAHNIDIEVGCNDNRVGGTSLGEANRMGYAPSFSGNGYAGVRVRSGALRNAIRGNCIFSHSGLGVDLGTYTTTLNDPCDGDGDANLQQNFPTLTKAAVSASGITIQGDLNSAAGSSYDLDFFASPVADSSGYGEGEIYLGSMTVTLPGLACSNHFVVGINQAVPVGWKISATATDPTGNTSEFSSVVTVEPYPALGIQVPAPGTSALLTWTNTATGYGLRMTDSLTPPVTWTVVTNAVASSNGQWVVTVPVSGVPARFYRLDLP